MPGPGPARAGTLTELQKYSPTTASGKHRTRYCTDPLPSAGRATNTPSTSALETSQTWNCTATRLTRAGARRGGGQCVSELPVQKLKGHTKPGRKGEAGAVNAPRPGWEAAACTFEKMTVPCPSAASEQHWWELLALLEHHGQDKDIDC